MFTVRLLFRNKWSAIQIQEMVTKKLLFVLNSYNSIHHSYCRW